MTQQNGFYVSKTRLSTARLYRLLALVCFASSGLAQAQVKCLDTKSIQALDVDIETTPVGSGCGIYITPTQKNTMVFRSYLFTDDGLFQIFNSFGNGDEATTTGARVYAVFPRNRKVNFELSADQSVLTVATANRDLSLAIQTQPVNRLKSASHAQLREDSVVNVNNNGGVEFLHTDFIYMDSGFTRGSAPQSNAGRSSVFHDANGSQCVVANSLVYRYFAGSASLRPDNEIHAVIARYCPNLRNF